MTTACSHRPGEVERQPHGRVRLDAEGVDAKDRCGRCAKYTPSRRHLLLEVLQTDPEISPAALRAAAASVCQQSLCILKVVKIYLEHA